VRAWCPSRPLVNGSRARLDVGVWPLLIDRSLTTVEGIVIFVRATREAIIDREALPIVTVLILGAGEVGLTWNERPRGEITVLEDVELVTASARLTAIAKGVSN